MSGGGGQSTQATRLPLALGPPCQILIQRALIHSLPLIATIKPPESRRDSVGKERPC